MNSPAPLPFKIGGSLGDANAGDKARGKNFQRKSTVTH
jgi:hypothetical protein